MPRTADEQLVLEKFGQWVKKARDTHEWTQEALGERAGMHRTYVGAIERGEKNLSLLKMNQLAVALEVGFDGFLPCHGNDGRGDLSGAKAEVASNTT